MSNWERVRLGNVCTKVYSGGTPKSTEPSYYGGDIPWLNTKEVNFNRIYSTEKSITKSGFDSSSAKWVDANSVIIAMYGATAGKVAINKIPLTTNQACCNLVVDSSMADYKFVYYSVLHNYENIASLANGGAQQNLNAGQIKDFEIALPSLAEQRRIAGVLSSLDDKIEVNNRINANLEAQAQALFKQWFVDFDFPDANGNPYRTSGGTMTDSPLGPIPHNWEIDKLCDLMTIKRGGSPRPIQDFLSDSGLRWLKISDITSLTSPFVFNIKEHIKESGLSKTTLLKEGKLVLSNSATPGIPKILGVETCIHDGWLHFPQSKLSTEFMYLMFLDIKPKLVALGNGSVFTNLKTDIVKEYNIAVPTDNIMIKFNRIVSEIFMNMHNIAKQNNALAQLRDTLLPKLMNNEIKL